LASPTIEISGDYTLAFHWPLTGMEKEMIKGLFVSVSLLLNASFAISCEAGKPVDGFAKESRYDSSSAGTRLNKHSKKFVKSYIRNNRKELSVIRQRSRSPFAIVDSVFNKYHLPVQLKYLAVIESDLKPGAVSRVGAVGPWQLMPKTARILGLKVTQTHDERTHYVKSTRAAARYLRDLHAEFGDWLLVLAAYNGGPGPVYRAMHLSGSRNFWGLQNYLPAESRMHVKKFIAVLNYFEGQEGVRAFASSEKVHTHHHGNRILPLRKKGSDIVPRESRNIARNN
jgi:membrane-bound lytic murein transglycosylase D